MCAFVHIRSLIYSYQTLTKKTKVNQPQKHLSSGVAQRHLAPFSGPRNVLARGPVGAKWLKSYRLSFLSYCYSGLLNLSR